MTRSLALVLVPLIMSGLSACGRRAVAPVPPASADPNVIVLSTAAQRTAGIVVETVQTLVRKDATEAPGLLAVDETRTARIGSLVEGIVLESAAQVGDRVHAGQVLATMHSTIVHEAWAQYRKAVAERRRLTTELDYAVQAYERTARLLADKAVALQDVQRAEANRVTAEEQLDMARTEVRRAEEQLEHLGITNAEDPSGESGEQIPVKSPIRGIVLQRLVTPGTTVTPGSLLFVVSDLSVVWALVDIDERHLSRVRPGATVDIRVAAYPDTAFPGSITFIDDMVNPKTRRVTVRCSVPNAERKLKPEMFVTALIGEGAPRNVIGVPGDAVHRLGGRSVVFVSEAEDRFAVRKVTTSTEQDGLVEVTAGLRAGERIAVRGSLALKSELLKTGDGES